jgi:FkbM family methyltransferase
MDYQLHLDKVVDITRKLLKNNPHTIFEMGANDCSDTLAFNKFFPQAKIFTFECNPDTLPICRDKVRNIKNIILTEKAVSNNEGTIKFYKTLANNKEDTEINHGASSIFESNEYIGGYNQEQVEVQATTIKKVCIDNNISEIDLLWMDMQGAELMALKGAEDMIKQIKIINTEVEFDFEYKNQPLFKDVKNFLKAKGFRLYTFSTMCKLMGDAVFVNTDLVKTGFLLPELVIVAYFRVWEKITGKIRRIRSDILKRL